MSVHLLRKALPPSNLVSLNFILGIFTEIIVHFWCSLKSDKHNGCVLDAVYLVCGFTVKFSESLVTELVLVCGVSVTFSETGLATELLLVRGLE
jgi:hypothetical protein